jgi:hypothetical protein
MNKEDILALFKAIDRFDTKAFVSYLDEEANFKFGNIPVVKGRNAIFEFVAGFFQAIRGIRHTNFEIWELEGIRFVNATVTYTRLDGSTLTVNFSNTFKLKGDRIKDYLIFIDNSELFKSGS